MSVLVSLLLSLLGLQFASGAFAAASTSTVLNGLAPANSTSSDSQAVTLGLRFSSDVAGTVVGVRFYKGAGNTGTHVGQLWSNTGALLASATFTNETSSGWQEVRFGSPVSIQAKQMYVISYFAPGGHYAYTPSRFAGAGVDNAPLHAPQSTSSTPNGVYTYGGAPAFPASTWGATDYGVDAVFTSAAVTSAPVSLFGKAVPTNSTSSDGSAVTLGLRWFADADGTVAGVRFYKGSGNTGTHTGQLWSSTGTLLATVTFTNETASGWQEARFASPVAVKAGTTYVVSYFAPVGHYAYAPGQLMNAPIDNAPLHAPQHSDAAPNGVYGYASSATFPTSTWGATNYGVDLLFVSGTTTTTASATPTTAAPTPTTAAPTTTTAPPTTTTAPPATTTTQPAPTTTTTQPPQPAPSGFPNDTNTGPTGTLTPYTGPLSITTNGTVIQNADIVLQDGQELDIQADNVQILNSRIRYVGSSTSSACRVCYGWWNAYRHGLKMDRVELDGNHRSEYGLRAYGDFTLTGSKFHAASHVIDAFGDVDTGVGTVIRGSYIYDSDDKPYATDGTQYQGHSAAVYFSGANSPVTITGNTIITPKYSLGPTAGGTINNATAAIAIYPEEGTVKGTNRSYYYDGNQVSGGGYVVTIRCNSGSCPSAISSLTFTNNVLTTQSGWSTVGGYGIFNIGPDNLAATKNITGNRYGSDVPNQSSLPSPNQ